MFSGKIDSDERDNSQQAEPLAHSFEKSPRGAGIPNVDDVEEPGNDGNAFIARPNARRSFRKISSERKILDDPLLADLIEKKDQQSQSQKPFITRDPG